VFASVGSLRRLALLSSPPELSATPLTVCADSCTAGTGPATWTTVTSGNVTALGREWLVGARTIPLPASVGAHLRDLELASGLTKLAFPFDIQKLRRRPVAAKPESATPSPAELVQEHVLVLVPLRDTRTELREGLVRGYNAIEDFHVIDWDEAAYQEKYQHPWPAIEPTTTMSKLDPSAKKLRKTELKAAGDWLQLNQKLSAKPTTRRKRERPAPEGRSAEVALDGGDEAQPPTKKKRREDATGKESLPSASEVSGESDARSLESARPATRQSVSAGEDMVGQRVEILF